MATAQEWFEVFRSQTVAINALSAKVAALQADAHAAATGIKDPTDPASFSLVRAVGNIGAWMPYLTETIKGIPGGGGGTTSVDLAPIVAQMGQLQLEIHDQLASLSTGVADVALLLSTEGAESAMMAIQEAVAQQTAALTQIAGVIAAGGGGGVPADLGPLIEAITAALTSEDQPFGGSLSSLSAALSELFVPSAQAADLPPAGTKLTFPQFMAALRDGVGDAGRSAWMKSARAVMEQVVSLGADVSQSALAPLGAIFEAITTEGIKQVLDGMTEDGLADPATARSRAIKALTAAYKIGQQAHFLAAAVEAFHPLHEFGLSNAAAAITDLAGFQPISRAVLGAHLDAAIGIPQRQQTNRVFQPEIPGLGLLGDFVRRRSMNLTEYDDWLLSHGLGEIHRDRLIETVWRDPTIRDLALALEDATVDRDWLLDLVRGAGYRDADADRLTAALMQRSSKSSRERVRASAVGAYAQGIISGEEFETVLAGLELRPEAVAWERQSADLQRRRDVVNDSLATYRRQYLNEVIERDDYVLAITALGVDPERIAMIVADADAARAPKIAAEEDRAIKAVIREKQVELVPRVRRLFELGLISSDQYRQTLIEAGVSAPVADQAVSLDAARLRAVQSQAGSRVVQAQIDTVIDARRDLLTDLFRKDLIDEPTYRQALLDTGLARDLVEIIVAREIVRKVPAPKRTSTST